MSSSSAAAAMVERLFRPLLLRGGVFLKYSSRTVRPQRRQVRVTADLRFIAWSSIDDDDDDDGNNEEEDDEDEEDDDAEKVEDVTSSVALVTGVLTNTSTTSSIVTMLPATKTKPRGERALLVSEIVSVTAGFHSKPVFRKGFKNECSFTLTFKSRSLRLMAQSEQQRDFWLKAFLWLHDFTSTIGRPFNVHHLLSVDESLEWKVPSSSSSSSPPPHPPRTTNDNNNSDDDDNKDEEDDSEAASNNGLNFELLELLGYGTYGRVHRATHCMTGYELAVKLVFVTEDNSDEMKREVNILKQCRHPNIVSYFGCWGPDRRHQLWILMELCACGSIIDLLKSTSVQLTEVQIAYILLSTLRALQYLHDDRQIVHRDIKGRNILITDDGEVKLTDFGGAQALNTKSNDSSSSSSSPSSSSSLLNALAMAHGTPYWMPPEVVQGTAADVWAIGITAIELATGAPPRVQIPPFDVLDVIVNEPPPELPDEADDRRWSDEFHDFTKQCLRKAPHERPKVATLLKHPFFRVNGGDGILTPQVLAPLCNGVDMDADGGGGGDADANRLVAFHSDGGLVDNSPPRPQQQQRQLQQQPQVVVTVSDPRTVHPAIKSKYIVYTVSTTITPDSCDPFAFACYRSSDDVDHHNNSSSSSSMSGGGRGSGSRSFEVVRRFNHFKWLHHTLVSQFPGTLVPDLPSDAFVGRFSPAFVQRRMLALNWFLTMLCEHPTLRRSHYLMEFLLRGDVEIQPVPRTPRERLSAVFSALRANKRAQLRRSHLHLQSLIKTSTRVVTVQRHIAQTYRSIFALGQLIEPVGLIGVGMDVQAQLMEVRDARVEREWLIPMDTVLRLSSGLHARSRSVRDARREECVNVLNKLSAKQQEWNACRAKRLPPPPAPITTARILHEDTSPIKRMPMPGTDRPLPPVVVGGGGGSSDGSGGGGGGDNRTTEAEENLELELKLAAEFMELQNTANIASQTYRDAETLYSHELQYFTQQKQRLLAAALRRMIEAQVEHAKQSQAAWRIVLQDLENENDDDNK